MRLSKRDFRNLINCYTKLVKFGDDVYDAFGINGEASTLDEVTNDLYMHILEMCGYDDDFFEEREEAHNFSSTILDRYLFEDYKIDLDKLFEEIIKEVNKA